MRPLDAALAYAEKFRWPIFPRPNGRFVKGGHGWQDATNEPAQISKWWTAWPTALIAMPTGVISGIIVLDIDNKGGKNGFNDLEKLGVLETGLPDTPLATTPHAGSHLYFLVNPEIRIRTTVGKLGPGLDVLADGTSVALPTPGWDYRWDTAHPDTTPFAIAPAWLQLPEPLAPRKPRGYVRRSIGLNPYADAAIAAACAKIKNAGNGQQHVILRREAFSIGTLAGAGGIPETFAKRALIDAGLSMTNHKARKWDRKAVSRVVDDCFDAGLDHPRPTGRN